MTIIETLIDLFHNYKNPEFNYWINISVIKKTSTKDIEKRLFLISNIRNKRNKINVLNEYLDTLISELIDNSGCNFIVLNLPDTYKNGINVTEQIVYDTFVEYGPIFAVHKYNDIAYLWFFYNNDAHNVCETVNSMQCEQNILQCQYTESYLIMNNYDWKTKTTYKTFNILNITIKLSDVDKYWKTIV